ncbi:hypothetical protein SO802_009127 [Lithocarpus litseifolius]|uniref:RRM domain-containing protein n=1 Tax=Lithocarpus litseifolius TaxID=425828 RepID=A0AAW2DED8_9ROSI
MTKERKDESGGGGGQEQTQTQTQQIFLQPHTKATNTNPATDDDEDKDVEKLLEPFTKDHLVALIKKGVSKHPDLIEIVRELADADPAHRKILVHGLDWDTTAETFTSVFGKYGEIVDCKATPTASSVSPKASPAQCGSSSPTSDVGTSGTGGQNGSSASQI